MRSIRAPIKAPWNLAMWHVVLLVPAARWLVAENTSSLGCLALVKISTQGAPCFNFACRGGSAKTIIDKCRRGLRIQVLTVCNSEDSMKNQGKDRQLEDNPSESLRKQIEGCQHVA
ncbi:hypothetical protein EDB89DRAFT_521101 [Lactarius sanguifluus]|nr:hypothetical protein EDB89DRAFT_521101 [Lactarius sanguifluus]